MQFAGVLNNSVFGDFLTHSATCNCSLFLFCECTLAFGYSRTVVSLETGAAIARTPSLPLTALVIDAGDAKRNAFACVRAVEW